MSRRKHFCATLLLGAALGAVRASADDSVPAGSTPATNHIAIHASLRPGETVGDHQIRRAFLSVGTNEIVFIVPTSFRIDATDPQHIELTDRTDSYFITVRVTPTPPVEGDEQSVYFRGLALNRFPGAKISSESSEFAGIHSGPAFNLDWSGASGGTQSARIVFIPTAAGVLEFCVLTRADHFKDAQLYLTILLGSVSTNEAGKIVIRPRPNFS
jgi:hypothetical protein